MSTAISVLVNDVLPDVIGCPFPLIETKVKETLEDLAGTGIINSGFKHDVLASDPTTPNDQITIATPAAFVQYEPLDVFSLRIDGIPYDTVRRVITDDLDDISSIVESRTKLWYPATAASIIMFPFDATAVQLYLQVAFKPLTTITSIEDVFYQEWHQVIAAGTKARLMLMPKKAWSNPQLGAVLQGQYDRGKNSAIMSVVYSRDREGDRRKNGFI
jgi:hypothetical protein